MFLAVLQQDIDVALVVDAGDHADGAVYPTLLPVVFDEDDLRLFFDGKFQLGGQRRLGELALDAADGDIFLSLQFRQFLFIDKIHLVAAGGEGDVHIFVSRLELGEIAGVQDVQVPALGGIVPNLIQDRDEGLVLLPIDLAQFDRHQIYLLEDAGGEEKGAGVEEAQYFFLVGGHDRLQLENIADEKQLLPPERQTHIVGEDAEDTVHAIDDVRPNHGYLIDDNQFDFSQELAPFLGVFEEIEDASLRQT